MAAVAALAGALAGSGGHLPAAVAGVALAGGAGLAVAAGAVVAALAGRRPLWLCVGVALLAGVLAQRSVAGLAPASPGPVRGPVTLVSDPEPDGRGGVAADVRWGDRRVRAVARGAAAAGLDDRLAGERVTVVGTVQPPGPWERRLRHRHLTGRLAVATVTGWRPGGPATRAANGLRRTLAAGASSLSPRQQSLLAGLTLGDDRAQPADMADAFEAAGLTHLLAVSGQNVAFVLVAASPLLARLRFGPRLAVTLALLAGFALLTRGEPSVLRATAMAGVAAGGSALGRPSSTRRALGLGVTAMLLVDPLLATSLGFQLSAAATAGIVLLSQPIERALPGPRWLVAPLATTVAAQAAVAPLLVATFGPLPVASLPANLLAGPAAGPVMVWGLTAGLVAGVVGGPVAGVAHLPTRALLGWLEAVAVTCARAPLGSLRPWHLVALAVGLTLLAVTRRSRAPARPAAARGPGGPAPGAVGARPGAVGPGAPIPATLGRVAGGLVIAGTLAAAAWPSPAAPGPVELGAGAMAWRGRAAVVLVADGRARAEAVLRGLREAGATRLDAVVLRSDARSGTDLVATLRRRWPDVRVLAPAPADGEVPPGAVTPPAGRVMVGDVAITVASAAPGRLEAEASGPVGIQRAGGSRRSHRSPPGRGGDRGRTAAGDRALPARRGLAGAVTAAAVPGLGGPGAGWAGRAAGGR
jgi:competence protein ComEC